MLYFNTEYIGIDSKISFYINIQCLMNINEQFYIINFYTLQFRKIQI